MRKRGLILEGGGMRGLFTAGVLDVWMEKGIAFNGLMGVSAGACFGCNYKSRQPGRVLRYNTAYAKDSRYCSLHSLLTTGNLFNADFCYRRLPDELDPFDTETFEKDPMPFYLTVTDADTGKPVYKRLDRIDATAYDWIRASASMPLVSRPVEIGGKRYLDGGLSDCIPIRYFESLGYDCNVIVSTRESGYRKDESTRLLRLMKPFLRRTPMVYRALRDRARMYNETQEYIAAQVQSGKVILITPPEPLPIGRISHDPDRMRHVYEIGRSVAEKSGV